MKDLQSTQRFIESQQEHLARYGFCLYAVEHKASSVMIGFVGLQYVNFEASFTPAVEIGWRLAYEYWGRGYATEAARAVLDHAFKQLKLSEVVAFTVVSNRQSHKVMQKIGMRYDPQGDFDHPDFDHNSPLRRHVLYRVSKEQA